MKVLDLFSGIGGFSLGLERAGMETVAFCEIDPFCQKVLKKHWPDTYIHDDVKTLGENEVWERIAQNALVNQLCKEIGGSTTCVKNAITNTKQNEETRTEKSIANIITAGLLKNEKKLLSITEDAAFVAEKPNTYFSQSTTNLITEILKEENIKGRFGSLPSNADFQTIIKYCVITAIRQRPSLENARIKQRVKDYDGAVDVICGGFPCQPFSTAGKRKGTEDDRHLWPAMFSVIKKYRPTWIIGENVAGHINMGLDDVLADLESEGYATRSFVIPACAIDAPHRRDRVWIIAYAECEFCKQQHEGAMQRGRKRKAEQAGLVVSEKDAANTKCIRRCEGITERPVSGKRNNEIEFKRIFEVFGRRSDISKSLTCGKHHGFPDVSHRLRALGNAVVPQIPEIIGRTIMEIELNKN